MKSSVETLTSELTQLSQKHELLEKQLSSKQSGMSSEWDKVKESLKAQLKESQDKCKSLEADLQEASQSDRHSSLVKDLEVKEQQLKVTLSEVQKKLQSVSFSSL